MSNNVNDLNALLGETQEYGKRTILPESVYPVTIHVGEPGITDPKEDGGGSTPFVKITASIYDGPFAGVDIEDTLYLTPGKKGGGLGLYLGATKEVTGQAANVAAACQEFGIPLPNTVGMDSKGASTLVREAIRDAFYELEPQKRLAFVLRLFNMKAWEGKKVIVRVDLETRKFTNADGEEKEFTSNRIRGWFNLNDKRRGMAHVKQIAIPFQTDAREQMVNAGVL